MSVYPRQKVSVGLEAGQAVSVITEAEAKLYDTPFLWSWLRAGAPVGDTYADRSRRGHHWKQTDAAKRPAIAANWRATGRDAFAFDGTTLAINADFEMPTGDVSLVAAFDLDATVGSGDNVVRAVLGTRLASGTRYIVGQLNRKLYIRPPGGAINVQGATMSVSTKYVGTWVFSTSGRLLSVRRDGGSWSDSTALATPAGGQSDITCQLGNYGTPGTGLAWKGHIAEAMLFNVDLKATRYAGVRALAEGALAARYGVTLP